MGIRGHYIGSFKGWKSFIFGSQIKGFKRELKNDSSGRGLIEFMSFGYTPYSRSFL